MPFDLIIVLPPDINPKNLELASPQAVTATRLYQLVYSPNCYIKCFTRRNLAQIRTNKSPLLKSYLHKVNAKTHPLPLCPFCNTNIHKTRHLFNCTHKRTTLSPLDLWTALLARWTEKLAGGPQAGSLESPH